jgi:hypothetical protein
MDRSPNLDGRMSPDFWSLYELMFKSRTFEEAVRQIWKDGKISGEMHLGLGEEAIVAGIISQLIEGDAMALDHRGTPPMVMRGVDPVALLREFMGQPDGLSGGMGGHMHLFAPDKLAASSGIVGASGPAATMLEQQGISAGVVDLRSVSPLDKGTLCQEVGRTGRMLVVDEDYEGFGLSGELAAVALESGLVFKYARVCTQTTIPYARHLEDKTLPSVERIVRACKPLLRA